MKYRTYKFPVNNGNEVARNSLFGAFIQLMMTAFPFTPFGIKFYPIKRRN